MNSVNLYDKIYGWVDSVLNPPSVLKENRIPIGISDDDYSALGDQEPFIVIGYTPASLTPIGNGGTRLDVSEKSSHGVFETGDVISSLYNFHDVSDGVLDISVDGEDPVSITGLDFTEALSMTAISRILQTEINNVLSSGKVVVEFSRGTKNYFLFTSDLVGDGSNIEITASVEAGTDITGYGYLNGGEASPGVTSEDTEQIYLTDYEGDVEIRQVYGEGEILQRLVNSKWLPSTIEYFDKNKFSLNDIGPIQGIPFTQGNRTIKESMMTCKFSFFGVSKEDILTIDKIGIIGTLTEENSEMFHEINIGG